MDTVGSRALLLPLSTMLTAYDLVSRPCGEGRLEAGTGVGVVIAKWYGYPNDNLKTCDNRSTIQLLTIQFLSTSNLKPNLLASLLTTLTVARSCCQHQN